MKRLFPLLIIGLLFVSCSERIVQLPETTNKDITEVLDVSPIYMFYDETQPDSIDFNRKNMISTTNWLVNVDKRLTLKQILPHLQYLQEKRQGDGMHKNENAKNYFTCHNTDINNLSFIEFTDTNFFFKNEYSRKPERPILLGSIYVSSLNSIHIGYSEMDHNYEEAPITIDNLNEFLRDFVNDVELPIQISFSSDISFQDYIRIKEELLKLKWKYIKILEDELVYN